MKSLLAAAIAVVLGLGVLQAQVETPAKAVPPGVATGYSVTTWTGTEAAPFGAIAAMAQDPDGYLWIGTAAGLFRFDGVSFTPADILSNTALPGSSVSALSVSQDGGLWIGFSDGGGIAHLRAGTLRLIDAAALGPVGALVEDRTGMLWAIGDRSLYNFRDRGWARVPVSDGISDVRVVNADLFPDGTLWVGTTVGLFRYVSDRNGFDKLAPDWAWAAAQDAAGTVWVTDTVTGFRRSTDARRQPAGFGNGYRLLKSRDESLWIATIGEGLWRARADAAGRPMLERAPLQTGSFSDSVESLLEDRDGNLWIGTTAGLHRLTRQKLMPLTNVGLVVTAGATGDAGIWAATNYGLVRFVHDGQWRGERLNAPAAGIRTMHRGLDGAQWVAANGGVNRLANGQLHPLLIPRSVGLGPVSCLTPDSRGGLWIGDGTNVLHWDRRAFTPIPVPHDQQRPIRCVYHDTKDRVWITFDNGTLGVLAADGRFRPVDEVKTGRNAITSNIAENEDGTIWVAAPDRVTRIAGDRVTSITRANGLPASRIGAIVGDLDGDLWVSMDLGLLLIPRGEFDRAAAQPSYRIRYQTFDAADGLAGAPILNVRAGRTTDGKMWFVRGGALTVADPRSVKSWPRTAPATVRVERATTEDGRFAPVASLPFAAGTKRVEIAYTAVALTQPGRLRFRYRLDGFDNDWIDAGTRRSAVYTNLAPGGYRFVVEAATNEQGWRGSSTTWDFRIRPAFYQTAWFYGIALVMVGAVTWGAWRFRVALVRREYSAVLAERLRLSREIHDTLLQGVVGVSLQLDALTHTVGRSSSEARHALVRTRRQVQGYIREARQSILDLRSPLLETQTLPEALRGIGRDATAGTPVQFTLTVNGRPRRCPASLENEILRIGHEAIANAVRHARAQHVALELTFGPSAVTVRVRDDGRGFTPALTHLEASTSYGLISMRERAECVGGQFNITCLPEGGTQVEAVLPVSSAA